MHKNKGVSQDTPFLCNQYENQVAEITVNLPDEYVNVAYFYYMVCKSPDPAVAQFATPLLLETDAVTLLPLNKVKYIVGSNVSWTAGNWEFCLLIKSVAMVDGAIGADGIVAVSEYFAGKIKSGIIDTDALTEQPVDANLQIAYDAALAAEAARDANEDARIIAEQNRISAEGLRADAELLRVVAESSRVTVEGNRVTAESGRSDAEAARVLAEQGRNTAENARLDAETSRATAENARSVYEAYDPLKPYIVGNKVAYNGSSYVNKLPCTGVLPTVTGNWLLIAAKGADGIGTGDMLAATYDSTNKRADAFNMDNMADGVTNKAFTSTERDKLSDISANAKKVEDSSTNGNIKIDGAEVTVYDDSEVAAQINDLDALADGHIADLVTDSDGVHGLKVEEGTFTPVIAGSTTAGAHTYGSQYGYYKKIGKQVNIQIYIFISAKDTAMAGNATIIGLPFAAQNNNYHYNTMNLGKIHKVSYGTAKALAAYITNNQTKIDLVKINDNADATNLLSSDLVTTTLIQVSGTYYTN